MDQNHLTSDPLIKERKNQAQANSNASNQPTADESASLQTKSVLIKRINLLARTVLEDILQNAFFTRHSSEGKNKTNIF